MMETADRTGGLRRRTWRKFESGLTLVENGLLVLAGVIILMMMVVITASAFGRYVFDKPLTGVESLVELFLAPAATYFAIASALRHRQHVGVTILVVKMPRLVRRYTQIAAAGVLSTTFGIIAYQGLLRTMDAFSAGRVEDITGIPLWIAYVTVPCGSAVFALRSLQMAMEWWLSGVWRVSLALRDEASGLPSHPS